MRSKKRSAEREMDQRTHELPITKSRARKFRKQGGARKKALLNRRRGPCRFDCSDLSDLIAVVCGRAMGGHNVFHNQVLGEKA
jgi:hypothetical protein